MKDNFLEKDTIDDANTVDLDIYRYDERLSGKRGTWCFKIREAKR